MRILYTILCVLFFGYCQGQATCVGGGNNWSTGSFTSFTVVSTFTATPTFVAVGVAWAPTSGTDYPTITDNYGNSYTLATRNIFSGWQGQYMAYTYGSLTATTSLTVTVTYTGAAARGASVAVSGYSNVRTSSNPLDKTSGYNSNASSVSTMNPGSITPTSVPNLIIFGGTYSTNAINTSVSGYNLRQYVNHSGNYTYALFDKTQTGSVGAENPTLLISTGSNGAACGIFNVFCNAISTRCTTCDYFIDD